MILTCKVHHQQLDAVEGSDDALQEEAEKLVKLQEGCVCCTLQQDLASELRTLAESGLYDYCVVECTGVSDPSSVAEMFVAVDDDDHEHTHECEEHGCDGAHSHVSVHDVARLDTCVTVVDAEEFHRDLTSLESFAGRYGEQQLEEHDGQDIAAVLLNQIEFANVVIINKADLVTQGQLQEIDCAIRSVNMDAKVLHATNCEVPLEEIVNTGSSFDMERVNNNVGWLQLIRGVDSGDRKETTSFVYRRRRPFHPMRLHDLISNSSFFDDEDSGIIRGRGYAWIANHHGRCGGWNQAGRVLQLHEEGPFLSALEPEEWDSLPQELRDAAQEDFVEPYGDHRQEIAFIGFTKKMNQNEICDALDRCLLSDTEFELGSEMWDKLVPNGDPFAFWEEQTSE